MKRTILVSLILSLFLVLATSASAALTITNPVLGGINQERDITVNQAFTVTNTGVKVANSLSKTSDQDYTRLATINFFNFYSS